MLYSPYVAKAFRDEADVVGPAENCEDSEKILKNWKAWVVDKKPAIVFINCGLHDIKLDRRTGKHQVEAEKYRNNLMEIGNRLKELNVIAVWALTTPVIDDWHNRIQGFDRKNTDVITYNKIASEVMSAKGIPVCDLFGVITNAAPNTVVSVGRYG